MTPVTKKYKNLMVLFTIFSILCFVGPLIFFTGEAFLMGVGVASKVALSSSILAVVILSIIAAANKLVLRSRLWILLLGLFFCLESIIGVVITIAVCQILDELIFTPLKSYYKNLYTINKEIDKRQ